MRIRDLQWQGMPAWPPEWWISDEGAGETGRLKTVQLRSDQSPACISIVASHLGDDRNGIIILDDPAHLEILCDKLKANVGKPLTEIGDLTIDLLSSLPKRGLKQVRPQIALDAPSERFFPLVLKGNSP
jgi:hypothetical protein